MGNQVAFDDVYFWNDTRGNLDINSCFGIQEAEQRIEQFGLNDPRNVGVP